MNNITNDLSNTSVNSIDAFETEINSQRDLMSWLKPPEPISSIKQNGVYFTGCGDSLVSAMLADVFSNGYIRSMDPRDIYNNPSLVKSKHLYVISVSGNTIANIRAANLAKSLTVITTNPNSKLAKLTDDLILFQPPTLGTSTAGSSTFLSSMLICISLASNMSIPNISTIFDRAKNDAKNIKIPSRIFVLGNLVTFPLAMYCAAKFYEVLGYDVHYCRTEQFAHMELFAARQNDTVIIFEPKSTYINNLIRDLDSIGIIVICPDLPELTIDQTIYCALFSQFITLQQAKRADLKECFFVSSPNRQVSNNIIYP